VLYLTLALFNQPTKVSVSIAKVPDNHLIFIPLMLMFGYNKKRNTLNVQDNSFL
jgi:hypothetical protein